MVACPHSTSAATTSRPKPCPCALSLSQKPTSGETESASSNDAMPKHSLLSRRRITKENLPGSAACTLFSHRATYSLHDGGSHGMNFAIAGVMHPKTSGASDIWNWLSCNLGDWMTTIVVAYLLQTIRNWTAGKNRCSRPHCGFFQLPGNVASCVTDDLGMQSTHLADLLFRTRQCVALPRSCYSALNQNSR